MRLPCLSIAICAIFPVRACLGAEPMTVVPLTGELLVRNGSEPSVDGLRNDRYALAIEDDGDSYVYTVSRSGGQLNAARDLTFDNATAPDVAVDPDDRLILAYDLEALERINLWFDDPEFPTTAGTGDVGLPAVAVNRAGNSVVLWEVVERFQIAIAARPYRAGGVSWWPAPSTLEPSYEAANDPEIACDQQEDFLAVWLKDGRNDLKARFLAFTELGLAYMTGSFTVDQAPTDGDRRDPRAFPLNDGLLSRGFVVTWWDTRSDPAGDAYARVVGRDGTERVYLTSEFRIESGTASARYPAAVYLDGKAILFAWSDNRDGEYRLYGSLFDREANRLSADFRLDDPEGSNGEVGCVDLAAKRLADRVFGDEALVAWQEGAGVYAKLVRLALATPTETPTPPPTDTPTPQPTDTPPDHGIKDPAADIDGNGYVDYRDLLILEDNWHLGQPTP